MNMNSLLQRFGLCRPLFKGIWLILCSSPSIWANANAHSVSTYPNPQSPNPLKCGIDRPGRICDPDRPQMLTKEERKALVDLVEEFTELTKMSDSIGIDDCARKGIKLGIALAHGVITENDENLDPNQKYQTYRDAISGSSYHDRNSITNAFDYIWGRLQRDTREEDMVAAQLAEKWHLLDEESNPNGCNRTMFIVMTADPPNVHIWSHPSVPISIGEKEAIIANNANLIATGEYADALKAIIANLRWLILYRQAELFGKFEGFPKFPPQYAIFIFWFCLSLCCLFSLVALLLAVFLFLKSPDVYPFNRIQIRMKNLIEKEKEDKEEEEKEEDEENGINHNPA